MCSSDLLTQKAKGLVAAGNCTDNYARNSVQQPLKQLSAWAASIGLCRTFWHFLFAVWVYLFAFISIF